MPLDLDLQALDRRIDVARGPGGADLLAQHVPRLDRLAQLDGHAVVAHGAEARKAELEERVEPGRLERVAEAVQVGDHVVQVGGDEMRQQQAIVQRRAPAHQLAAIGLLPEARDERAQQQHLHHAHARVRRHLEGAQLDQAEAAGRAVGRIELVDAELGPVRIAGQVDEQVAQQAVDQPGLRRLVAGAVSALELLEGDARVRRGGRRAPRRRAAPGWSGR